MRREIVGKEEKQESRRVSAAFKTGAIALVFLIVGYQVALFVQRAAVSAVVAHRDKPDTVFVFVRDEDKKIIDGGSTPITSQEVHFPASGPGKTRTTDGNSAEMHFSSGESPDQRRIQSEHSAAAKQIYERSRPHESFRFNPNTVGLEDLQRLGFSEKQAQAIINYREKGGRFRRKEDFAKSFVVADSVYRRLEKYIDIPLLDINAADSAAFDALPGIGGYFASKMVSYREKLCGYSFPEQLMDIYHFDEEKYNGLKDLITVGKCGPYPLWTLPEEELKKHPYLDQHSARAIVLFRENSQRSDWTVAALYDAGIISEECYSKLSRCRIADP